jgi:hypothetical protein
MGRTCTQISVNGNLTIPQHKPDIESILRITATTVIDKSVTIRKKVIFIGHVLICVEYVACVPDSTQPKHFVSFAIPFNGLICHRFARANLKACLKTKFLFQDFQVIDLRTIKQIIALELCILKFARIGKSLPAHCSEPCHIICKPDKPIKDEEHHHSCEDEEHHHSCEDEEHHHSCEDEEHHHSCKDEEHHHSCKDEGHHHNSCKDEPHHHSSKDEPHQHSSKSKPYHNTDNNEHSQYGDFHLPISVQPLMNRRTP